MAIICLVAAGCGLAEGGACAAPKPGIGLKATVSDTAMEPSALGVCRGQEVTLELASETDGTFHLHGYDDQVPAVKLEPGETATVEFTADVAGQFIIELHAHSGGSETEIGVLTVNEP